MPSTPEFQAEYESQAHRVQTGCAWLISIVGESGDANSGSPKHLLTGNMLRAADMKALVDLLISKGLFTEDEYLSAVLQATTAEAERLEQQISAKVGVKVTLI